MKSPIVIPKGPALAMKIQSYLCTTWHVKRQNTGFSRWLVVLCTVGNLTKSIVKTILPSQFTPEWYPILYTLPQSVTLWYVAASMACDYTCVC